MLIYDCFQYFNEDHIVDLRLNILNNFIDKFIIVESRYSHSGQKKKLNFNIKKFNEFKDKIIYLVIENEPEYKVQLSQMAFVTGNIAGQKFKYVSKALRYLIKSVISLILFFIVFYI